MSDFIRLAYNAPSSISIGVPLRPHADTRNSQRSHGPPRRRRRKEEGEREKLPLIFAQSDADAAVDDCDDDDDKTLVAARERLVRLHRCKASCLRVESEGLGKVWELKYEGLSVLYKTTTCAGDKLAL